MINKIKEKFDFVDIVWILYFFFSYTFYIRSAYLRIDFVSLYTTVLPLIFLGKKILLEQNHYLQIKHRQYTCLIWYLIFVAYELYISYNGGIVNNSQWALARENAIIFFALCYSVPSAEKFEKILYDFAIGVLGFGLVAWLTSPVSTYGSLEFGGFPQRQRNLTAYVLGISFVIFIYHYIKNRIRFDIVAAALCAIITILTGSRKGILQLVMPFAVLMLCQKDIKKFGKYIFGLAVVGGIVLVILLNNATFMEIYGERLFAVFNDADDMSDMSVYARNMLKLIGLAYFVENPIWGYGLGASWTLVEATGYTFVHYFHNNFVEVLVCGGIIGFTIYYGIIFRNAILYFFKRKENLMNFLMLTILLEFIILSLGQVTVYSPSFSFVCYFVVQCHVFMKGENYENSYSNSL